MEAEIAIDAERPEELLQILKPSLTSDNSVSYNFQTSSEEIVIKVETEGIGALRGCTDTVFRLSSLARKQY